MTVPPSPANTQQAPPGGLALSCAVLLLVMLAGFGAMAAWTTSAYGNDGLWAALVGFVLCTGAAMIALVISVTFANTPHAMSANLGVMLVRMGLPLAALLVLQNNVQSLAGSGLGVSILCLYLLALVTETLLALRHVKPNPQRKAVGSGDVAVRPLEAK